MVNLDFFNYLKWEIPFLMGWKQDQIDRLLDEYLDGNLTEEEVRLMHETLENGGTLTEAELDKIVLPVEILQPNKTQTETIQQPAKKHNAYRKLEEFKQYRTYSHPIVETSKAYTLVFIIVFFTIVVMAPFVYMLLPIHFNTDKIFQSHFTPYPIDNFERNFNNNVFASFNWEEGVEAYQEKNYDEVVYLLNDLLKNEGSHTDSFIDHFYLGISYLGGEKPDSKTAIDHFNKVLTDTTPMTANWKAPTHWYLALSYLQLNKTQNTRKHLKEIITEGSEAYHYQEALKLLEEI